MARKHSNNLGFLNDQDYEQSEKSPLLVIIGDSFVEAAQVENRHAMHSVLQKEIGDLGRIYSFGVSGSPLSTYLAYAGYTGREFKPKSLVFIIVANDFDESLLKHKKYPGFYHFDEKAPGEWDLVRVDYHPTLLRKILRTLGTTRYLILNVGLVWSNIKRIFKGLDPLDKNLSVGNVPRDVNEEIMIDSRKAIDVFFQKLPGYANVPKGNVLFLVDGMRPHLYDPIHLKEADGSFFDLMRTYLIHTATERDYEVIDLQPVFIDEFQKKGQRFEFEFDYHWNIPGHKLVAREIQSSKVFSNTFFK